MNNGVSCLCLTFGRPHLLEEAIESFLRQSWEGPKELIVVNDHPDQTIVYDHPQVVVVNLKRRLRTLGEKRNLSVALSRYDNLLVWDDDDIYLPWRIEETMKTLPTKHFFKCPNAWLMNDGKIAPEPSFNLFHGGSAYTRWLFEKSGGYTMMNGGEDADIENKFQNVTDKKGEYWPHTHLSKDRLYYIYRWNHGHYHATGHKTLNDISPEVQKGEIKLSPKWNMPYQELAFNASGVSPAAIGGVPKKLMDPINFVCFSKNRPLQLDGYIRSYQWAGRGEADLSIIYTCDQEYQEAYDKLVATYPWINFVREKDFSTDLISVLNSSEFTCFGCDDVVFTRKVDWGTVLSTMRSEFTFAFSLRLGKNIKRSMFAGQMSHPEYITVGNTISWDLHKSHAHGDFGYSWELNGTVYPTDIVKKVIEAVKPTSPNILEANGGGRWSVMTPRRMMYSFHESHVVVPTVNVVQTNFQNQTLGKCSTKFLLDAWHNDMRLDISRYRDSLDDCIHIPSLFMTNVLY